jgi:dipeptidyl aminopeptidase/acylaminoacyl peptidase
MKALNLALWVALAATPLAAQQRPPISPADYYRLVFVSEPAVSPSGAAVAFTVTTVVESKDSRHREIWLSPTDGSAPPYRLTSLSTEGSGPVWSPDGSLLAFSSRRDSAGVQDEDGVWFLRMGALAGEAFRIRGVHASPVWSPDGNWIAYTWAGEVPDSVQKNPRRGWVAPDAISKGPDPRRFDGRVITHIPYKADGRGFLGDLGSEPRQHIYVVAAAGGEPRQLTDGALSQRNIAWSPDGRSLAFVQDLTERDERRPDQHPDIYLADVSTGAIRRLTTSPGYHNDPALSPDGKQLAFTCAAGRGQETDVCVMPVAGGDVRNLTGGWSLDPRAIEWSADGSSISFNADVEGNVHLFRVASRGGPVTQVTQGLRQLSGFSTSADGKVMAYVSSDMTHPGELFVAREDGSAERRLTGFNDTYLSQVTAIPADTIWYPSVGGLKIEGWLHQPFGYEAGKKYPLILYIHGGPHGQYGNVFFHEFQMLAGQGYWVLFTNPRGSTGYGHDFTYATRERWGMEDYQDLMKGVDEVIRRTGQVDTTRMAVLGGSYGGFMTNWIVGHTNRFAVAESDRAISNWFSWYGSSDAQGLTEYEFDGFPWTQDSLYHVLSPFSYVTSMKTPLLMVHSEEDYRVPITDAEQLFMALKKRGVPVEFVRYPRSSHGLSRNGPPWLLVDRLERIRTWFAHWIGTGTTPGKAAQQH